MVQDKGKMKGWTRLEFDFDLSKSLESINIDYAMKNSSGDVKMHLNQEFGSKVKTIVLIKLGEIPRIVTCFPRLGA